MKLTNAELKSLFRWQPARTELNRVDCLSSEKLTRIGLGDVSESERLQIADHLVTCPDCTQEYQIVLATKSWADQAKSESGKNNGKTNTVMTEGQMVLPENTDEIETSPKWWHSLIPRFFSRTGFNPFTAAVTGLFLITSLSLGTWLIALHFKHKAELARIASQQPQVPQMVASDEPISEETLQARIDEVQKQLTDVQTQLTTQNADRVLSNQELLGIQNETLQKEMDEIAKPQLDAPVIELASSKLLPSSEPGKEAFTTIEIPPTAAMFTVIITKPADKYYPNYQIELLDPKKTKPLWSGAKKAAPEPMKISLSLVRRNYPSGKYRIRLSGVDGKKKDVIDTYNLDVKYAPPPKAAKKKK